MLYILIEVDEVCAHVKSLQSCLTLCDAMDCNPQGSSVHGILQARILEVILEVGVPFPTPGGFLDPGIESASLMPPALAGGFFTTSATWEAQSDEVDYLKYYFVIRLPGHRCLSLCKSPHL